MEHFTALLYRLWQKASSLRYLLPTVFVLLLCFSLLRALQGVNIYDDGFVLSAYALVFTSPGSVAYSFLYYWQIIFGGLWYTCLGDLGIYGFRLLEIAVLLLNAVLVARLSGMAGIHKACVAMAIIFVFSRLYWIEVFEYNTFSAFVALSVSLLMMKAFVRQSCLLMFFAGTVFGLGVFIRLPNVALSLLLLSLIPYHRIANYPPRTLRMALFAIAGALVGILSTLVFMSAMGHLPYFEEALADASFLVGNSTNSHGSGNMLYALAVNYAHVGVGFIVFSLCPVLYTVLYAKCKTTSTRRMLVVLLFIIHVLMVIKFSSQTLFMMNAMCIASCFYVGYVCRDDMRMVCLASLAFLMSVALPLGSDWNITTLGVHNIWLALPLVPYAALLWVRKFSGYSRAVHVSFIAVTLVLLLARNAYGTFRPAYYEHGARPDDTYRVNHPRVNVLTDQKTASDLDGLLAAMRTEVSEGDTVLTAGSFPMLHYLTLTRTYLHNSWPWIFGADYCRHRFNAARAEGASLPVVVCSRVDIAADRNRGDVFMKFLRDNRYATIYSNDSYLLLVPPRDRR